MSFSSPFTAVTGATFTAAQWNTSGRDNLNAIWVGTTAGDMEYYTSASAKSRLALTVGGVLYGGASAPTWLAKPASADSVLKNTSAGTPSWKPISEFMPGTTAGDMDYYTASAVKTRLAIGNTFRFLMVNGSGTAPTWASIITTRQGGSSTNWQTAGTTTQTITDGIIEVGVLDCTTDSGGAGSVALTYPLAFAQRPILIATVGGDSSAYCNVTFSDDSTTGCTLRILRTGGGIATVQINWMAVGTWT